MIRPAIKFQDNVVMVFDGRVRQLPKYQGQYEEVKEGILRDAPPDAVFAYFSDYEAQIKVVSRGEW